MHLPSHRLSGEGETEGSYFCGVQKGKRGRGAEGKIVAFGLLKRKGKVNTAIIPHVRTETLMPIIEERVEPDSIACTDMFRAYNALDASEFHHHMIGHATLFAIQGSHINEREILEPGKTTLTQVQRH